MTDPHPPGRPPDFDERWAMFVDWMNAVRENWPVEEGTYRAEVQQHFFALLNHPSVPGRELTIGHGVKVLENNDVPAKDAGFIMFVLFVSGAIWGNRGVIPKTRDEDVGLGAGSGVTNREDLQ